MPSIENSGGAETLDDIAEDTVGGERGKLAKVVRSGGGSV